MDKSLLLRALVSGTDALLSLNGMVLCKLAAGQEMRMPVHEYIQSGENRIQVLPLDKTADKNPRDTGCGLVTHDCSVTVWVELQKDRGASTLVQPQVLFELTESFRRGGRLNKNRLLDVCVNLPVSFPRWRYLDVLQSTCDESDSQKIQDFLLSFLTLIQTQKLSSLLPYFSIRNREIASAYGLDMQQVHAVFSAHLLNLCTKATLPDSVLNPQSWHFHSIRNTAVYALLNTQHQPLLEFKCNESNTTVQFPMHVGVLGGEVFVLR